MSTYHAATHLEFFRTMKKFPALTVRGEPSPLASPPPPAVGQPYRLAAVRRTRSPRPSSDHSGTLHHWFGITTNCNSIRATGSSWRGKFRSKTATPTADDVIRIGMVDTQETMLGSAGQDQRVGMAAGLHAAVANPGSESEMFGTMPRRCHVCRVMDVKTKETANAARRSTR